MTEVKTEQLKPCPFCGGEAEKIFIGNDVTKKRSVEIKCSKCSTKQVVGAIRQSLDWCDKIITEKWNTRFEVKEAPIDSDIEAMAEKECPEAPIEYGNREASCYEIGWQSGFIKGAKAIRDSKLIPGLQKSTENLSKIKDKDKWLTEIRGAKAIRDSNLKK